jgi:hypothetical protein
VTRYRHWRAQGNSDQICNIKHARVFLAELRRKVPVNDDDLIPANLPRQALRNEVFALLAVGREPGSGPETGFWEVRQIGTDKSASL